MDQIGDALAKTFSTRLAGEGSLSAVNPLVVLQRRKFLEGPPASRAGGVDKLDDTAIWSKCDSHSSGVFAQLSRQQFLPGVWFFVGVVEHVLVVGLLESEGSAAQMTGVRCLS